MAIDLVQATTDLRNSIMELPLLVKFNSEEVNGTKTNLLNLDDLVSVGLADQYGFSVMTIKADWTTVPTKDDVVELSEDEGVTYVNYRVLRISIDSLSIAYRLDIGSVF